MKIAKQNKTGTRKKRKGPGRPKKRGRKRKNRRRHWNPDEFRPLKGNEPFLARALKHDKTIRTLYEKFFKPIADNVTNDDTEVDYLEQLDVIMSAGFRVIREFKIVREINKLPGDYAIRDARYQLTTGRRNFPVGYAVFAAFDERENFVRIEITPGWHSDESHNFRLTIPQFRYILNSLEPIKRKEIKRYKGDT